VPERIVEGPDGENVAEITVLTQVGQCAIRRRGAIRTEHHFSFRSGLRSERGEPGMSVIAGRVSVEEAVPLVCRGDSAGSADAVRYAVTEDLRKEGFTVTYRKSRIVPGHAVVLWPDGEWDEGVLAKFSKCFSEYVPGPG